MQIAWAFLLPLLLPGILSISFNTVYRLKTLQGFFLTGSRVLGNLASGSSVMITVIAGTQFRNLIWKKERANLTVEVNIE
ncbi:hypothetical protein [Pantoea sp. App145]|uniref:hypothetical protein n=1 Tax=Pantoea sp. App145 TaxID=3071567 RepID=UPI003A7FC1C1